MALLSLSACFALACAAPEHTDVPPDHEEAALFVEATQSAGLGAFRHTTGARGDKWMPETYGAGGAFIDYDGDGWVDVFLVQGGAWDTEYRPPAVRVYRNNHDGTFRETTAETGLSEVAGYGFGLAATDYDQDGDTDIFVSTLTRNLLLRNDDGHFVEAAQQVGLGEVSEWSTAALFFDADLDGWADLYVGNYVPWTPATDAFCSSDGQTKAYCTPHQYEGLPARFYHNNGDGTFTDQTRRRGLGGNPGKTLGVAELDYDGNGYPDLVVANDLQRDLLYKNLGDGTFIEIGQASGIAYDNNGRPRAGMGVDAGVVDGTGKTTVFVGNFSEEMAGVYRYMDNDIFLDQGPASGIGLPSLLPLTFGVLLFDAELDGDLDLLLANGHIIKNIAQFQRNLTYKQAPLLFFNDGQGHFEAADMDSGPLYSKKLVGRGAAFGDYDRDGDLDLLLTENGGPAHLWQNTTDPYTREDINSLQVALINSNNQYNPPGVQLEGIVDGLPRQIRRFRTGGSYLSQSEQTVTFGLGSHPQMDSLIIRWPSGQTDTLTQIPADQRIVLREGLNTLIGNAANGNPAPVE